MRKLKAFIRKIIDFIFGKTKTKDSTYYIPVESPITSELINLINEERKTLNLRVLIPEVKLNALAKLKVEQMIADKLLSHNGFNDRLEESQAVSLCENVAFGYLTELGIFKAYLKSDSHKRNLLNIKVSHIGSHTESKYNCILFAYYKK